MHPCREHSVNSTSGNVFDRALSFVLLWEGGYVNHPADPGGETNYGISKRSYPDIDIKNLTRFKAAEIYRRDYWNKAGCDDLPPALAVCVFDFAVNSGVYRAKSLLRTVLGLEPEAEWERVVNTVHKRLLSDTVDDYQWRRTMFLIRLNKPQFIKGWMRRVVSLSVFAGSLLSQGGARLPQTKGV